MDNNISRRKVSNVIVDSKALLRLSVPFFILLLSNVIIVSFISWKSAYFLSSANLTNPELVYAFQAFTTNLTNILLYGEFIFGFLCLMLWLFYSHRILGPVIPIRRQIKNLIDKNYDSKIILRKNDEFKEIAEDLNQLTDVLKNSRGQSLVQVLISVAIMGILMLGMISVQQMQSRENRALSEKLAAMDLQKLVSATLADGTVCFHHIGNLKFDSSQVTPTSSPAAIGLGNVLLSKAPTVLAPSPPPIVTVNAIASPISNSVFVQGITLTNIRCEGCPNPSTSNSFTAHIQIQLDTSRMIRSIVPVSSQVTLTTTGGTIKTITGCLGVGSAVPNPVPPGTWCGVNIVGPSPWWGNGAAHRQCDGQNPSGGCPAGYSQLRICYEADHFSNCNSLWTCIKD